MFINYMLYITSANQCGRDQEKGIKWLALKYTLILCFSCNIQISIRTLLMDSQPEECSCYVLNILANFNLDVLTKSRFLLKKICMFPRREVYIYFTSYTSNIP